MATQHAPTPPPTIAPADQQAISAAHTSLLSNRALMITGLGTRENSPYRTGIFVDALISGIVAHLHEVAKGQARFATEVAQFGPGFANYARGLADECGLVFSKLK